MSPNEYPQTDGTINRDLKRTVFNYTRLIAVAALVNGVMGDIPIKNAFAYQSPQPPCDEKACKDRCERTYMDCIPRRTDTEKDKKKDEACESTYAACKKTCKCRKETL